MVVQRFWDKTQIDPNLTFDGTPCRIWTGAQVDRTRPNKYGRYCAKRRWWVAHQFAYTITYGPIPEGLEIDHLCRRSLCVEPTHLEAVTPCENQRRAQRARVYSLTCPQGHLWTRDNIQDMKTPKGVWKRCAQCNRDHVREWNRQRAVTPLPRRRLKDLSPECRNGHKRTKTNTRFAPSGAVVCKACQKVARDRWSAKKAT